MDNVLSGMDLIKTTHAVVHHTFITANVFNYPNTLFNDNRMGYDANTHLFAPASAVYPLRDLFVLLVFE